MSTVQKEKLSSKHLILNTSFRPSLASIDTHENRAEPVTMSDYFGLYRF